MPPKKNHRQFQVAKGFEDQEINLPQRQTKHAAGYDFEASEDVTILPIWWTILSSLSIRPVITKVVLGIEGSKESKEINSIEEIQVTIDGPETDEEKSSFIKRIRPTLVPTGVKASMGTDEALFLYNRSSNPLKKMLLLGNGVGVIDADYYENQDNDGHIMFQFLNLGLTPVTIKKGERIGQGVFAPFLKTNDDNAAGDRQGGHGSTN